MSIDRTLVYNALLEAGAMPVRRGRYELLRLSNPGSRLDVGLHPELIRILARETDSIYRVDTTPYWNKRPDYFSSLSEIWTAHAHKNLVGWIGVSNMCLDGSEVIYVDTLNVRPCSFGRYTMGAVLIHEVFLAQYLKFMRILPFAMRTQNPGVYRLVRSLSKSGVYPPIVARNQKTKVGLREMAVAMAERLSPGKPFDAEVSVIRKAFPGELYSASMGTEADLLGYWNRNLRTCEGDALVVVVAPDLSKVMALASLYLWAAWRDRAKRTFGRNERAVPG
jgi:hypothetical protein